MLIFTENSKRKFEKCMCISWALIARYYISTNW